MVSLIVAHQTFSPNHHQAVLEALPVAALRMALPLALPVVLPAPAVVL
jgi:hypothetical protein